MSSLKMTFSLTSLILIFGLVFVTMPVMAHEGQAHGDGAITDILEANTDHNGDGDIEDDGEDAQVLRHTRHPQVMSIVAKPDEDPATLRTSDGRDVIVLNATGDAALEVDADNGPGQFTVIVTFDNDLASGSVLATNQVEFRAWRGTTTISGFSASAVTQDTDNSRVFEVTITVPQDAYWDTLATPPATALPVEVYIDITAGAVTSPTAQVGGNLLAVANSYAFVSGAPDKFTIVEELPEYTPPVDDPPTATITGKVNDDGDKAVFTITFSEEIAEITTGSAAFTATDFIIDNGTADDDPVQDATDTKVYTLTVTPTNPAEPVTAMLIAGAVDDTAGQSNTASDVSNGVVVQEDTDGPTVEITVAEMLNSDDDAVFTLTFNEALGTGSAALSFGDINISGGSADASDLTGPDADNAYTLTVTPDDSTTAPVSVSLDADSVEDVYGNLVDLESADSVASAVFDNKPPTVVITPPAAPDATTGKLLFTFAFSEPIDSFTASAIDRSGSDNVELLDGGPVEAATSDPAMPTYELLVTPTDPAVDTTVLLLIDSVKDEAGNGLASDVKATYALDPPPNTAPVFEGSAPTGLTWCEAEDIGSIVLPLAKGDERDSLTYSLTPADQIPHDTSETPPAAGLYWITTDTQAREIRGAAEVSDAGTYTWTVSDGSLTDTMTFTIVVTPYAVPMAVTDVAATKVDATAMRGDDVDKVTLTWTDPNPTSYPNATCIPAITSYTVTMQELNTHTQGRTAKGQAVSTSVTVADATMADGSLAYTTDKLDHGTYEFTVTAVNVKGSSDASDEAIWDRTGYHWIIVNDAPGQSGDLRANETQEPTHSVTLDWIPPTDDPNAPVNDVDPDTLAMALYGVDTTFGGYHVEVTNESTAAVTIHPTDDTLIAGDQRTYNISGLPVGEYTARIVAHNIVGAGALSDSQDFEIDVYTAGPDPTDPVGPVGPPIATQIASKGYLVVVPANYDELALPSGLATHTVATMPNLADFLRTGGAIDVAVTGKANHDVIITEIMVAEDLGRRGGSATARPAASQWLELYNNTAAAISVSDIAITFTTGYPAGPAPANATDRFSNTVAPGWAATTFAGALSGQTTVNTSGVASVTGTFKSLRRSYKKDATNYDDNKTLQDAGTVIGDGWSASSWKITADSRVFLSGRVGTPGSQNRPTVFSPAVFTAPPMNITFSEIANRSDDGNEWIELKGPAGESLKKVKISKVTAIGTEATVYQFPDNDDVKFPSNGILLITDRNPADSELAADLENGVPKEGIRYRIRTLEALPNDGNFLLVLRNTGGGIEDVAGHATDLARANPYTTLWPLAGNVGRISAKNKLEADKVYRRARNLQGYSSNKDNGDEPAFAAIGWTGIGYDRNASTSAANGGTPGYPHGAYINAGDDATQRVIISEIMYSEGRNGNLAQWIELQNLSATTGVDLHNWRLYIVNHDNPDFTGKVRDEVWLRNMKIPPKQTALIVSHSGRNTTNLPSHRVLNLRRNESLLSTTGFALRLEAKSNEGDANNRQAGDMAGNLIAFDSSARRVDHQAFVDPVWELPSGMDENEDRMSISRRTSANIANLNGMKEWHWIPSDDDPRLGSMGSVTYYGHANDIGSPGQTVGSVLPVSLSKFRPERLKNTGEVVIRWATESETNNAGFNILRGEALDGEFTKLNTKLIAGKGTTSERTTYEYADTSAKPNVVYYYQIQDVSLDGEVQTLRTTHLRGNVSAAGKLATTWGELKALQ